MKSFLIEQIYGKFSEDVPLGDHRVLRAQAPLDTDCTGRTLSYILDVSERDIARDLLLQSEGGLRIIAGFPDDLGTDG